MLGSVPADCIRYARQRLVNFSRAYDVTTLLSSFVGSASLSSHRKNHSQCGVDGALTY